MKAQSASLVRDSSPPPLVAALLRGEGFPHAVHSPRLIETHISWVILTGERAYKIKKPVNLGFLDFSTLERRRHFCAEELRLNRRFAPSVYLDVVPIGGSVAHPKVGSEPALEWAVCMAQFPAQAEMGAQLAAGLIDAQDMTRLAESIAAVHDSAAVFEGDGTDPVDRVVGPARDNFADLEPATFDIPTCQKLAMLRDWTERYVRRLEPLLTERVAAGRIRECHGDLHTGNIVRIADTLVPFDCLEFDPSLRRIDAISDIAFLVMDLLHSARDDLGYAFLNRYLEVSGDYQGLALLPWYLVYRAMVRAKVTAIARDQHIAAGPRAETYIELAARLAEPATRPLLVVCRGLSGSGKTWLSTRLVPALPAIRLRSDLIRKQMQGLAELTRTDSAVNEGLYAPDLTRQTYAALEEHAQTALSVGCNVIVDATCLDRESRLKFADLAATLDAGFVLLNCEAPEALLRRRIAQREQGGSDASEADLAVLDSQVTRSEPLAEQERPDVIDVDTSADVDILELATTIRARAASNQS